MKRLGFLTTFILALTFCVKAQDIANPYPDYDEFTFIDMDFKQNLATPTVDNHLRKLLAKAVKDEADRFQQKLPDALKKVVGVSLIRDGEVLVVTYPADELFNPNDSLFSKYADRALQTILPLMKDPYRYKVVFAVSTDDTGSESYRYALADARMNSIFDWFEKMMDANKIKEELVVIPEPLASDEPLADNLTRENRRKNRRIEFYFVPGPSLIDSLK